MLLLVANRNNCIAGFLCMLLWVFMLVLAFSLLCTTLNLLAGTGILIEGSNGTFYECFTAMPRDGVRIIRFLTDIDSMAQSNQTCSFLSKSEICDPVFVLSGNSFPWIDVNGTEIALACESLDPEGLEACSRYASALNILCGFELFFFFFFPFSWCAFSWICYNGNSKEYFARCICCTCYCCERCFYFRMFEERQPLLSRK